MIVHEDHFIKQYLVYSNEYTIPSASLCCSIVKKSRNSKSVEVSISQNEQDENSSVDDILAKEIESWKDFRYALREESALLFIKPSRSF